LLSFQVQNSLKKVITQSIYNFKQFKNHNNCFWWFNSIFFCNKAGVEGIFLMSKFLCSGPGARGKKGFLT